MRTLKIADAKKFIESPDEVDMYEFDAIDADAAAILATAETDELNFGCMSQLSVEAARALSKFPGMIRLSAVIEITPEVLREFKNHEGGMWLSFESADKELMEALPKRGAIDFTRLRELNKEAASALKDREGDLTFGGINVLEAGAAGYLATVSGDIDLSYVRRADAEALQALAKHQGSLKLGLVYLDKNQAKALAAHNGNIVLDELRLIMPEVAEILTEFPHSLSLSGALVPGQGEKSLRKHAAFDEAWICNEVLDECSADLMDESGNGPDFGNLRLLGSGAMQKLIEKKKDDEYPNMSLSGIVAISDKDAETLSTFRGMIELGVRGLSDAAASSLAKHRGSLHLGYLADISETGAKALSKHKDLYVSESYLPGNLHKIISNSAGSETDSDDEPSEESPREQATNNLHFTLGRLRARFEGGAAARMGGFDGLLDELQQSVDEGADLSFLKLERVLIEFLEAVQRGEPTDDLRKKLEDSYWEG